MKDDGRKGVKPALTDKRKPATFDYGKLRNNRNMEHIPTWNVRNKSSPSLECRRNRTTLQVESVVLAGFHFR